MLHKTFTTAYRINPDLKFEVFIHKVDGIRDEQKIELQREIHQRTTEELAEAGVGDLHLRSVGVHIYITCIYAYIHAYMCSYT